MKSFQLAALAVLSAFLLSLPWLGLTAGWVLFIAFIPLLIIEDHLYRKRDEVTRIHLFKYAFICTVLWNAFTTWWLGYAFFFGAVLIILLNALCMASVWLLFHQIKKAFNVRLGNFALVVFWLAFEFLHFNWDIEWPWLSLGNGFANQVQIIQWYEYTGVLGGSLWVLVVNLLLFQLTKSLMGSFWVNYRFYLIHAIVLITFPLAFSWYQYKHYSESGDAYEIIIVQPNVDPYTEKFDEQTNDQQMQTLLVLSDSLITNSTDYVLGPETAIPPLWENDQIKNSPLLTPFFKRTLQYPKLNFIIGATTQHLFQPGELLTETARENTDKNQYYDIFNSAIQICGKRNVQIYHKSILVSGVEKMPYSKYFSFVEKYIVDLGGTAGSLGSQPEPTNLIAESGLKVAPIICYESVFGEYVGKYVMKGASLLFVLTNDGWWRNSSGYLQHLSYSRLRAIESRRSIARAANTGISALIDQRGNLVQHTAWWTKTAIKGTLHANDKLTFYVRYGDYIGRISMFISIMILLYFFIQKKVKQ